MSDKLAYSRPSLTYFTNRLSDAVCYYTGTAATKDGGEGLCKHGADTNDGVSQKMCITGTDANTGSCYTFGNTNLWCQTGGSADGFEHCNEGCTAQTAPGCSAGGGDRTDKVCINYGNSPGSGECGAGRSA